MCFTFTHLLIYNQVSLIKHFGDLQILFHNTYRNLNFEWFMGSYTQLNSLKTIGLLILSNDKNEQSKSKCCHVTFLKRNKFKVW